jgi:hypothetical protein
MPVTIEAAESLTIRARSGLRSTETMQASVAGPSSRATLVNRCSQKWPVQPSSALARRATSCFTKRIRQPVDRQIRSSAKLPGDPGRLRSSWRRS